MLTIAGAKEMVQGGYHYQVIRQNSASCCYILFYKA